MRPSKKVRQKLLVETIDTNPFVTDEELAEQFSVSVQTIRLDRMELAIPELRERIKTVAEKHVENEVKSLPMSEVIGEVIDLNLDQSAISIFDVQQEHVFTRNSIARGHHLFAQANSLAVAVINDELALTVKAKIHFTRSVKVGERVVAKAKVRPYKRGDKRTIVEVESFVGGELAFRGEFEMFRSSE
ncbi:transcription factor FapR [Siminovitchia acidinfaciens]|uniref:Transcription factor FapR n=1 Tax=Siminovitchia acidinfaciens TaxID=2321395 RepID=A0A429Y2I7_9BACI|nr:transcription factor FapR [Siminovitchia acidinfaciens]RST75455.1 transcription factor FapR [Siminovitchia acidinfaciens]